MNVLAKYAQDGASRGPIDPIDYHQLSHSHRLDPELLPQDFDPEYGVGPPDGATLEDGLLGDLIGCEDIKLQLKRVRSTFVHAERLGRDPREVRIAS